MLDMIYHAHKQMYVGKKYIYIYKYNYLYIYIYIYIFNYTLRPNSYKNYYKNIVYCIFFLLQKSSKRKCNI